MPDQCSQCGTPLDKGARFCRSCGAVVAEAGSNVLDSPTLPGITPSGASTASLAGELPSGGRKPPWVAIALFAVAAAVVALAAVLLLGGSDGTSKTKTSGTRRHTTTSSTTTSSTTTTSTSTTTTTAPPPTTTRGDGSAAYLFPQSGWITLVASLNKGSTSLDRAISDANARRARGMGEVNVLDSDRYSSASLNPGLWIEYLGPYSTRIEGDAVCNDLHARGLVAAGDRGCYTKPNPLIPV